MNEIELIENSYGSIEVDVTEAISFTCLGGASVAKVTVWYQPKDKLLELISFSEWMRKHFVGATKDNPTPLEGVVAAVYEKVSELVKPYDIIVTAESMSEPYWKTKDPLMDQIRHGPMHVTKDMASRLEE